MFGLLEIHGPISAIFDNDGATIAEVNPYSWARKANMIYIDNPVGAGYSYTSSDNLPTGQESIGVDLYQFLIQWFKLFPQYQGNEFFPFGESYAGKQNIHKVQLIGDDFLWLGSRSDKNS